MHDSLVHVVLTTAASDHVENGTNGHASADHVADPVFKIGEGQRRAENVKQGLDPERVYECAIFMDIGDLQDDAQEKECEEASGRKNGRRRNKERAREILRERARMLESEREKER